MCIDAFKQIVYNQMKQLLGTTLYAIRPYQMDEWTRYKFWIRMVRSYDAGPIQSSQVEIGMFCPGKYKLEVCTCIHSS